MIIFWILALIFKLAFVSLTPLTSDENYYWVWAQNLALSYYDHPAAVAWLFKAGSWLPEFMLKWPSVILGHSALLVWDSFLKNLGWDEKIRWRCFALAVMAPLVGMTSLVLTPDLPMLFFQALAIYAFERALTTKRWIFYSLFGLSLGLGFSSKYLIVLLVPCLFVYLVVSKKWREVRWDSLLWVILFGLIGSAPVLLWNAQQDWVSVRFQLDHGIGKKNWNPEWPFEYLLSLFVLVTPFYFKALWEAIKTKEQKLLLSLSLPILLFFALTSLRSKVEANWSQLAFLPLFSLFAFYEIRRWTYYWTLGFWTLIVLGLSFALNYPWSPSCPGRLCEARRYETLLAEVKNYQPFLATNYQMASYLWFQTKTPVYKLYQTSRMDYFDIFPQAQPQFKEFYVAKHRETKFPPWIRNGNFNFETIKALDPSLEIFKITKRGVSHD